MEAESDVPDNASVISIVSENSDIAAGIAELDDDASMCVLTDKLSIAVDSFTEKRPETRVKALKSTICCLRAAYLSLDSVTWNYASTCLSGIEFVLKKGRTPDRKLAAECLAVLCVQFDNTELPDWLEKMRNMLETIANDPSEPHCVRGQCIVALTTLIFFSSYDNYPSMQYLMRNLEIIFRGSCPKGDGKTPLLAADLVDLHLAALNSWTLLYTILPDAYAEKQGKEALPSLMGLIRGSNVNVRITAGELIALVYERVREAVEQHYRGVHFRELAGLLDSLATDSDKSRSKDDRKRQRHSFREIADSVLRGVEPDSLIRFGSESMRLTSWRAQFLYDHQCSLLLGGITRHLRDNLSLRQLFDLGAPVPRLGATAGGPGASVSARRSTKAQRNYNNQFAGKVRTQQLSSRRDKRTEMLASMEDA